MRKIDRIIKYIIVFLIGGFSYGVICEALIALQMREDGDYGGEAFIIPLMILLIAFGFNMGASINKK